MVPFTEMEKARTKPVLRKKSKILDSNMYA